jgi:hypothetical protein
MNSIKTGVQSASLDRTSSERAASPAATEDAPAPATTPEVTDEEAGRQASRRILGPDQETPSKHSVRVEAAVHSAEVSLERLARKLSRVDVTDGTQVREIAPSIDQAARALSAAISNVGADASEDVHRRERLIHALGAVLEPLRDLTLQITANAMGRPSRKTRTILSTLENAYARLLAPTAGIFRDVIPFRRAGAGEFLPIPDAVEIVKAAHEKLKSALDRLESAGKPALSPEAEAQLFRAILTSERAGLVTSIDVGLFDFLPEHLAKAITRDHHSIHFDPKRPQVSTTMLIAEEIGRIRGLRIPLEEKIARLENEFRAITTNNMGDAIFATILTRHLPELVEKGGIEIASKGGSKALLTLEMIWRLGRFEDFEFFGSTAMGEGKKRSAPGEIVLRDLIHLVLANYHVYDQLLLEFGVKGSDRFDDLSREDQKAIVERATARVEENLKSYEFRLGRAQIFKSSVDSLKKSVLDGHEAMAAYLLEHGMTKEDVRELGEKIFFFFDPATGGRFASWDAPGLTHKSKIQWQAMEFPQENGESKWGFVLAVPPGRTPTFLDTSMTKAFGPRLPKAITRGDNLMFVFNPADGTISPIEMAKMLLEELRAHAAPETAEVIQKPDYPPLIGENVISHDAYIYDDLGRYQWTPERFEEAKSHATEAYFEALKNPAYKKVVLTIGLPRAGKSSWIREHNDRGTLFFDSTLTTPEKRAPLIEAARKAGKSVEIVVVDTPLEICLARSAASSDREIPDAWIRARSEELKAATITARRENVDLVTIVRPR